MVCEWPMGNAASSYARLANASSTKRWRGTADMAFRTRSSLMPRPRRRCTIAWRSRSEFRPRLLPAAGTGAWAWRGKVAAEMRVLLLAGVTPGLSRPES
ncbi:hypothetical protein D3C71_1910870 [compost metagenome]